MRTRRGLCYPKLDSLENIIETNKTTTTTTTAANNNHHRAFINGDFYTNQTTAIGKAKSQPRRDAEAEAPCRKRARASPDRGGAHGGVGGGRDLFDALPDDLVLSILCKLSSSAACPADLISVLATCKRFNGLGLNSMVLAKACPKAFAVRAKNWSESAHRFLKLCADAGNVDASYTLGMIRFYCLESRGSGASLMAKAAINSHAQALYSLAVVQFNGSGGSKGDKDLRAGVALCARAAFLGHVDALRELGHCLQDGYGVKQNVSEGRRFLVQANARELASALSSSPSSSPAATAAASPSSSSSFWVAQGSLYALSRHCAPPQPSGRHEAAGGGAAAAATCPLLSDFGCNVPAPEAHPANRFLTEWFESSKGRIGEGLRLCSHRGCGRPETRRHEFRRCSVCGAVNYCSRACQALDWKLRHKADCAPMERWAADGEDDNDNVAHLDGNGDMDVDGGES